VKARAQLTNMHWAACLKVFEYGFLMILSLAIRRAPFVS
jgi:hypothetical protein